MDKFRRINFPFFGFLIFWIFSTTNAIQKIESVEDCFLKVQHRALSGSIQPLAKFYNISPLNCMRYCLLPNLELRCITVVYHKHFSTCQLYDEDGSNNLKPGSLVMAAGHDYYQRRIFDGICGVPRPARPAHTLPNPNPASPNKPKLPSPLLPQQRSQTYRAQSDRKKLPEVVQPSTTGPPRNANDVTLKELEAMLIRESGKR